MLWEGLVLFYLVDQSNDCFSTFKKRSFLNGVCLINSSTLKKIQVVKTSLLIYLN